MYDFLQPHGLQHARLPCPSLSPEVCTNSCLLNQWFHSVISSSVTPFSSCPQSFLASRSFTMSRPFTSGGKVLELQHQPFQLTFRVDFLQNWLVWSPCCSGDSQDSFPARQLRSLNPSVLSLLYGPALMSIHDYWQNHSCEYMKLCWQSDVYAF